MRISDWSSDVCSSDLVQGKLEDPAHIRAHMDTGLAARTPVPESSLNLMATNRRLAGEQIDIQAAARQQEHAQPPAGPPLRMYSCNPGFLDTTAPASPTSSVTADTPRPPVPKTHLDT